MTKASYIKSALALAALEFVPPSMREKLIEQQEFRDRHGLRTDAVVTFDDVGISLQRSELFAAVRRLFADEVAVDIQDGASQPWKLTLSSKQGNVPIVIISNGAEQLALPNFAVLSPDSKVRICLLDQAADDVNLPAGDIKKWREILSDRSLQDDEFEVFQDDFLDTPIHVARTIRTEVKKGQTRISSMVPSSRKYFERLIGIYDGSLSIKDFAAHSGKNLFKGLCAWRSRDGLLLSLLLSSHSALTNEIDLDCLDTKSVVGVFDFLITHGDRISQLGAIEVGLRILSERPEMESYIIRLIEQIRSDDVEVVTSEFELLSALFVLVDGQLARTRLLSDMPPFYRRLASLSQAALIQRELVDSSVDIKALSDWAFRYRGKYFYFQSLTDMRLEPRWDPDLSTASQIKADFIGRIIATARNHEQSIIDRELYHLILGDKKESLHSLVEFPRTYFPGPLEGNESSPNVLPDELAEIVEGQLRAEQLEPASFIALVNSALIFRIEAGQADLAAKALKLGSYRLKNIEDQSQLIAILNGLATVASVTKMQTLADELRVLVRHYRRDAKYALSIDAVLRICLVAAASCSDFNAWRDFLGDWVTELAFDDLRAEEGSAFYANLRCLCHVVPALWVTCGRADAALAAFNAS